MLSCFYEVFLIVSGTFSHKLVQTCFVWLKTSHTTLFGICYCVKNDRIENNIHILEITCYVVFLRFLKRFWHFFSHKLVQTWFLFHENFHITLFGIYYFVEMVNIENNRHMIEITC